MSSPESSRAVGADDFVRRRIVVGLDGSDGSVHALLWAMGEAAFGGASVRAVHAQVSRSSETVDLVSSQVEAARGDAPAGVEISETVVKGHPVEVMHAEATDCDLLVVGSRGHGGFRGLLLGSVSQQTIEHSTIASVVVPAGAPLPDRGDVVIGVDGSDEACEALAWSAAEAVRRDARLVLVHTWYTPVAVPPEGLAITAIDPMVFRASAEALLTEVSANVMSSATHQPREVVHQVVEKPAATGLLHSAEDANLLVVGGRGRGGFAGLLLGSVSQQCIRHSPVAVAVIPRELAQPASSS